MSAELEPVIVDYVRTPIGRFRGGLKEMRADDLAGLVLAAIVARGNVPADELDDVVLGCANQAGEDNRNVARMALLLAGLPDHVPGVTVNRLCASGLEAVWLAARSIKAGEGDLFLAGGVESMTRAPLVMAKPSAAFPTGPQTLFDTSLGWRFPNEKMKLRFPLEAMGETAENVQAQTGITREAQDRFALTSHQRAVAAASFHAEETIAVEVPGDKRGSTVRFDRDEGPRADSTLEKLARLGPVFRAGGTVTAGNSSPLNDGAAALLVCSAARARKMGWKPLARIVTGAAAGVDPRVMGVGPIPATRKALARAGWTTRDLDRVELNEAFAVQSLAVMQGLELSEDRVNVNGGAIAIGHPLGCSGARLAGTLARELVRSGGKRGLASLCVGVGQGLSLLLERM
ncbi:MAG: acetyl-CoA C-acyltransferase [Polyangia bacterium]